MFSILWHSLSPWHGQSFTGNGKITCLSSSNAVRCQHNPQASPGMRSRITSSVRIRHQGRWLFLSPESIYCIEYKILYLDNIYSGVYIYLRSSCIYIHTTGQQATDLCLSDRLKSGTTTTATANNDRASWNFFPSSSQPSGSGSGKSSRALQRYDVRWWIQRITVLSKVFNSHIILQFNAEASQEHHTYH